MLKLVLVVNWWCSVACVAGIVCGDSCGYVSPIGLVGKMKGMLFISYVVVDSCFKLFTDVRIFHSHSRPEE